MPTCRGKCEYIDQWVDNLRDFETWTINWYTREITVTKGVSGPGKDALENHANSLKIQAWTKRCGKGCTCDGKWTQPVVNPITLRMADGVYGAYAICKGDLHRKEYAGDCVAAKPAD